MKTHKEIDRRSLAMSIAIAGKIDRDPAILKKARVTCDRWLRLGALPAFREWSAILDRPWSEIRAVLLEDSERGRRLRQSSPFCGILTPVERWQIYKTFAHHEATRS